MPSVPSVAPKAVLNAVNPKEKGFSLVEVSVAMAIMGFLMLSVANLFLLSNYATKHVEEITRLSNIAQFQAEEFRRLYLSNLLVPTELGDNSSTRKAPNIETLTPNEFKTMLEERHAFVVIWSPTKDTQTDSYNMANDQNIWWTDPAGTPAPTANDLARNAMLQTVVDDYGMGHRVMAWVYWWVKPSYGSNGLEIQLHVDSGYRNLLGASNYAQMPFLNKASVRQTIIIPGRKFYYKKT